MTLTLGITYLTLLSHERQRTAQGANLRTQANLMNSLVLSDPNADFPDSYAENTRVQRHTLSETIKDRWNSEIQGAVRAIQHADWESVREGLEGAVSRVWTQGLKSGTEGIEKAEEAAAPVMHKAMAETREFAHQEYDAAKAAATRAAERTLAKTREAGREMREAKERGMEDRISNKDHMTRTERYEVEQAQKNAKDAGKSAWQNVKDVGDGLKKTEEALISTVGDKIHQGYEAGKKVAKRAGGRAEDRAADVEGVLKGETDVQRALRQRYQRVVVKKSVEELLAERYRPVTDVPHDLRGL